MKPGALAIVGLVVAAAAAVLFFGPRSPGNASGPAPVVKIGMAGPLTGDQKEMGISIANAVDLVVEEWNSKGGVLGRRLEVVKRDDQAMSDKAKQAALDLVAEGVVGVVGHFNTGCTIPASEEYKKKKIPMITPSSTNPQVTDRKFPNVFRVCGRDDVQGPFAADYCADKLGVKKVAILHDKTPYGKGLADVFRERIEKRGIAVVYYDGFDDKEKIFRPYLTAIQSQAPDLYYFGGIYHQAGPLVLQARDLGIGAAFMSGDGTFEPKFLDIAKSAAEGAYLTFPPDSTKFEKGKGFLEKYRKRFGRDPGPYSYPAHDAAQVLLEAIAKVGTEDREQLCGAVRRTRFKTLNETILEFDEKGDVKGSSYVMWKVVNGRFQVVE